MAELDEIDEYLADLRGVQPIAAPPVAKSTVRCPTESDWTDEVDEDFLSALPLLSQRIQATVAPVESPEQALKELRAAFPEAPDTYLQEVVNIASRHHIAALLQKKQGRTQALLRCFMQYAGTITSQQLAPLRGRAGGAVLSDLKDTGLQIDHHRSTYTLNLRLFNLNRITRTYLTPAEKNTLRVWHLNGDGQTCCNLCGSTTRDVQFDHRISVVLGGAKNDALDAWQIVCRRCNNDKETACESCPYRKTMDSSHCRSCSWAYPEDHTHTAGSPEIRVNLTLPVELRRAVGPVKEWLNGLVSEAIDKTRRAG